MPTSRSGLSPRTSDYTVDTVTSKDGTLIGYRRYGSGPAVVLVQGAIGVAQSFHELASDLSADFSVYVPERRGRPMSPSRYTPQHAIERERDDIEAMLERSGATRLFGLSSGAVIALEAARVLPSIDRLVVFEPPFHVPPREMRRDLVSRLNSEIAEGRTSRAMLTAVQAAGFAPALFRFLPRPVVVAALEVFLRSNARAPGDYPPLRDVVPSVRFDFAVVSSMQDRLEAFRAVRSEVLLISAARSPAYLQEASRALESILPNARRVELPGTDHGAPWNADRGGKPSAVADAMREFLKG
jgi:surfactin synthase thioesterase subunit